MFEYCPKCRAKIEGNPKFCPECGNPLSKTKEKMKFPSKKVWIISGIVIVVIVVVFASLYVYSSGMIQSGTDYHNNLGSEITPPVNQKPAGYISPSQTFGNAPLTTNFEWIGSDPDGFISTYQWNFGDAHTSNEKAPTYTFTNPGTYTVSVTVTDNEGETDNDTTIILVYEPVNQEPPEPITEISLTPIDDSYIALDNPDLNHGNDGSLFVRHLLSLYYQYEDVSFLKFDITQLESTITIKSAVLKLYVDFINTPGTVSVHRCSDNSWSEDTITWNNAPSYSSNSEDSQYINSDGKWVEWNVTNYLKDTISYNRQITFVFSISGDEGSVDFDSKDYRRVPVLEIDWE